jgi:hypothetical protein
MPQWDILKFPSGMLLFHMSMGIWDTLTVGFLSSRPSTAKKKNVRRKEVS